MPPHGIVRKLSRLVKSIRLRRKQRRWSLAFRHSSNIRRAALRLVLGTVVAFAPASEASAQDQQATELVPQVGHWSDIASVDYSPDGARVLSASEFTIKLWDV